LLRSRIVDLIILHLLRKLKHVLLMGGGEQKDVEDRNHMVAGKEEVKTVVEILGSTNSALNSNPLRTWLPYLYPYRDA
jgi:uncharacterized protein (UPF0216 family)